GRSGCQLVGGRLRGGVDALRLRHHRLERPHSSLALNRAQSPLLEISDRTYLPVELPPRPAVCAAPRRASTSCAGVSADRKHSRFQSTIKRSVHRRLRTGSSLSRRPNAAHLPCAVFERLRLGREWFRFVRNGVMDYIP